MDNQAHAIRVQPEDRPERILHQRKLIQTSKRFYQDNNRLDGLPRSQATRILCPDFFKLLDRHSIFLKRSRGRYDLEQQVIDPRSKLEVSYFAKFEANTAGIKEKITN